MGLQDMLVLITNKKIYNRRLRFSLKQRFFPEANNIGEFCQKIQMTNEKHKSRLSPLLFSFTKSNTNGVDNFAKQMLSGTEVCVLAK